MLWFRLVSFFYHQLMKTSYDDKGTAYLRTITEVGKALIFKENGIMSEVKIAIMNLTGRAIDFELIQKFIVNEKNTMFYLNRKLNSSTEYGTYNDYLWLDTGIRDSRNNPIMICLHNVYDGFVGHYTGTVRELANRLKQFKGNNGRKIEKNLSRFMSKYKAKAEERLHEIIADEMEYAVDSANRADRQSFSVISDALNDLNVELPESLPGEESIIEVEQTDSDLQCDFKYDSFSKEQDYIDELLMHIEKNEKDSQEEIIRLKEQNKEYKRALVDIRTFMQDENDRQDDVAADMGGHGLLGRNEKILVLGNADIRVAEMRAIAREYFGFEKTDFEFITDYEKIKNAGSRIHASERFAAVIVGNCPHKVAGMGNYSNIIDEFKSRANCPIAVDARNEAGGLKITKQSFKKALADICRQLKIQEVA